MLYSEVSQDKTAISYRDFVSIVKQISEGPRKDKKRNKKSNRR